MKNTYDLIVIGAGPAGLAAALEAVQYDLSVVVLDDQAGPGGQIFRAIERIPAVDRRLMEKAYLRGKVLAERFRDSTAEYLPGASVWQLEPDRIVSCSVNGSSRQIKGKTILIATGAMERPVPIPGWTLPGVMGAAAADVILKSSNMVPAGRIVLAGSGPFLYLVAGRLAAAGSNIEAILDTMPRANYLDAIPYLPRALFAWESLLKGLVMFWKVWRFKIPVYRNAKEIQARGRDHVESVLVESGGRLREIQIDGLLLHEGVIPNTQLTRQIECEHEWDPIQYYWKPVTDAWGFCRVEGVAVAGDTAGIGGAEAAEMAGSLVALEAARRAGAISKTARDLAAKPFQKSRARVLSVRPFLDHLYRPVSYVRVPRDDTIVCRCEEITAGQIRDAVTRGGVGPNQIKSQTRCGMGPCQGRMCGTVLSEIIADSLKIRMPEVGYYTVRAPIKPVPLGEVAEMEIFH